MWPPTAEELIAVQADLAVTMAPPFVLREGMAIGACFVCFERGEAGPGKVGDRGWAAAAVMSGGHLNDAAVVRGKTSAAYEAGLLALREGPLLEAAVGGLAAVPDVLLVNATGRDHPRRAGLALHLGAMVGVPSVGVTHRPLFAEGEWPAAEQGAHTVLLLDKETVGFWVRTCRGARPLAVHAAWRTTPESALWVAVEAAAGVRTPEPLRQARRLARRARAEDLEKVARGDAGTLPPP